MSVTIIIPETATPRAKLATAAFQAGVEAAAQHADPMPPEPGSLGAVWLLAYMLLARGRAQ